MTRKRISLARPAAAMSIAIVGLLAVQAWLLTAAYRETKASFAQNVQNAIAAVGNHFDTHIATDVFLRSADSVVIERGGQRPVGTMTVRLDVEATDTLGSAKRETRHETYAWLGEKIADDDSVQVTVVVFDGGKLGQELLFDTTVTGSLPPEFLDSLTAQWEGAIVSLVRDSNVYLFHSDTVQGTTAGSLPLTRERHAQLFNRTMARFLIGKPLSPTEIVDSTDLDAIVAEALDEQGIRLESAWALKAPADSGYVYATTGSEALLSASAHRGRLLPLLAIAGNLELLLAFPGEWRHIGMELLPLLALSLLFSGIMVMTFMSTIRAYSEQVKVGDLTVGFITNLTHEFKTPLATIGLTMEALQRTGVADSPERREQLHSIINSETQRLRTHTERILQLARLEEGNYELDLTTVDVHEMISTLSQSFAVRIQATEGSLSTDCRATVSEIIGDRVQLEAVLSNLIDNAIKYASERPHVNVSTSSSNQTIVIRVSDNGIGIPRDHLTHVFKKYYRVESGNRHDVKGFGVGLSFVKLVVEAHGGGVRIESSPSEGTTVEVVLPLAGPRAQAGI